MKRIQGFNFYNEINLQTLYFKCQNCCSQSMLPYFHRNAAPNFDKNCGLLEKHYFYLLEVKSHDTAEMHSDPQRFATAMSTNAAAHPEAETNGNQKWPSPDSPSLAVSKVGIDRWMLILHRRHLEYHSNVKARHCKLRCKGFNSGSKLQNILIVLVNFQLQFPMLPHHVCDLCSSEEKISNCLKIRL